MGYHEKSSQCTYIYDIQENEWIEGPSLLAARSFHSSCAIKSDDGTTESIVIVGGEKNDNDELLRSTEILKIKEQKWISGPTLPIGLADAACVELPPIMNFACLVIGGRTDGDQNWSSNVYGLDKSLSTWRYLGDINECTYGLLGFSLS